MVRVGIVDFDSSHSVEFTRRLNHVGIAQEQWVEGARVVAGCVLPSAITDEATVKKYVATFTGDFGLPLVERPADLLGKIDAVCIESVDGSVHLERARPFLEAGLPVYVDKPFTCSLKDAREMVALAARHRAPLFSSSSLRYAPEVAALASPGPETGAVLACDAYSPASVHPRNPGLFHYGIHGVETLYTLMGPGCESVCTMAEAGGEVTVGRWKDHRTGTMRGTRAGAHSYGFTAFCEKKVLPTAVSTATIYRELLKHVVDFFRTGRSPVPVDVTVEIVAFIEASLASARAGGAPQPVASSTG